MVYDGRAQPGPHHQRRTDAHGPDHGRAHAGGLEDGVARSSLQRECDIASGHLLRRPVLCWRARRLLGVYSADNAQGVTVRDVLRVYWILVQAVHDDNQLRFVAASRKAASTPTTETDMAVWVGESTGFDEKRSNVNITLHVALPRLVKAAAEAPSDLTRSTGTSPSNIERHALW